MSKKGNSRPNREGGAKRRHTPDGKALSKQQRADLVLIDRMRRALPEDEMAAIIHTAARRDPATAAKWEKLEGMLADQAALAQLRGGAQPTLTTLAWRCGIRWDELVREVRQHRLDLALIASSAQTPEVLEDLARDAKRHEETCPTCGGDGTIERKRKERDAEGKEVEVVETEQCKTCKGKRTVMVAADKDARRLHAEIMGLVGAKGGAGVTLNLNQQNQTLNVGAGQQAGGLEELLRRTQEQKALPQATVIEVKETPDGDTGS